VFELKILLTKVLLLSPLVFLFCRADLFMRDMGDLMMKFFFSKALCKHIALLSEVNLDSIGSKASEQIKAFLKLKLEANAGTSYNNDEGETYSFLPTLTRERLVKVK
jgi:hypothetical protein